MQRWGGAGAGGGGARGAGLSGDFPSPPLAGLCAGEGPRGVTWVPSPSDHASLRVGGGWSAGPASVAMEITEPQP